MKNNNVNFWALSVALTLSVAIGVGFTNNFTHVKENKQGLVELTPLIETDVWLRDTANKTSNSGRSLSTQAFNALILQLQKAFNDSSQLIYTNPESNKTSLIDRNKLIKNTANFWNGINTIRFYESWAFNPITGEVIKKQLGYCVVQFDQSKKASREWYYHFTTQNDRNIYLKYW